MSATDPATPCVLIVCDTDEQSAALCRHLQPLGAAINQVPDCSAAIAIAQRCEVALLLVDLQSPMMDGFEAVRLLGAAARTAHVPIILITESQVGLAERQRGHALGGVAILQRQNLDVDALQDQIRLLLDLRLRANALQRQIHVFLDDHARIAASNAQVRALQPRLHRHLLLDLLTGLPNRMFFDLHLMGLVSRGARSGKGFALVWMDLDHLKRLNDRYQRGVGDQMLLTVAQRLEALVRSSDVLARIEGDTYGLILDDVTEPKAVQAALEKLLAVAGEPLEASTSAGQSLTLIPTLSVGVAIYPRHGEDAAALLSTAQRCAQQVLTAGGDGVQIGWNSSATIPPRR